MSDRDARIDCLEAASRVWAGRAANADEVLATAKKFLAWVDEADDEDEED